MSWKVRTQKPVLPWDRSQRGLFHFVFENKASRLPQPGAQAYALESYGLVEFSPIGPTAVIQEQIRSVNQPYYVGQAVALAGIPMQAGGIRFQPLVDPSTPGGYSTTPNDPGNATNLRMNVAFPSNMPLAPNTPHPGL